MKRVRFHCETPPYGKDKGIIDLIIRYGTAKNGKRIKVAEIYTFHEHGIGRDSIDQDALRITDRLASEGFSAYIVGGAVRDLLLGKKPKDFDVATDALPRRVRKLFWQSRIIGKRFRLVHVQTQSGKKIIEVSTFRSGQNSMDNSIYGSLDEDVKRRDFSCNALYYAPKEQYIIDYVGGLRDIRRRRLSPLLPNDVIFTEDPVRMIRAVKYSVMGGLTIPFSLRRRIRKDAPLLEGHSSSRLTEELFKILQCGYAAPIFKRLRDFSMLAYILPGVEKLLSARGGGVAADTLWKSLSELDASIAVSIARQTGGGEPEAEITRGTMLSSFLLPFIAIRGEEEGVDQVFRNAFKDAKEILKPLTPSNADLEEAVRIVCREKGLRLPRVSGKYQHRKPRARRGRRRPVSRIEEE